MTAQSIAYQWSLRVGGHSTALRFIGLTAALAAVAATMAAPIRADMMGNAFLSALTNAGVAYSTPASALAAGQSVCPLLIQPDGSFDSVVSKMAAGNGLSQKNAGIFTIIAIATYCPYMLAPLLPNRLQA
jgi:sugar/nucleoside kinase (ribokinase family)